MLSITRRGFIRTSAGASVKAAGVKFKVGVTDWNLRQEGKLEAVSLAKELGFDGVQVRIGKGTDRLPFRSTTAESVSGREQAGRLAG